MLAASENYKGIKFVRISSLPLDQKNLIRKSINRREIIKILKEDTLLNDCVQYEHYVTWYKDNFSPNENAKTIPVSTDFALAS